MVDAGRRDMKGDGDGWYLRCCTRRRRPTRCQFLLCLFTRESPFGGVCIHMQYIIHGLYFMKRNNENDRFLFPWCYVTAHAAHGLSLSPPHNFFVFQLKLNSSTYHIPLVDSGPHYL